MWTSSWINQPLATDSTKSRFLYKQDRKRNLFFYFDTFMIILVLEPQRENVLVYFSLKHLDEQKDIRYSP